MEASILSHDPARGKHVLLLREGPWAGKPWIVDLHICDNPLCGCADIEFSCVPAGDPPHLPISSVRFVLDTENRVPCPVVGGKQDTTSEAVAEAVASELGETGWDYLWKYLLGVKQKQIDECDVRRLDADFPSYVFRGETSIVGYGEIFPLVTAFSFRIEPQPWVAVDGYCVSLDCECREVLLEFARSERSGKIRDTVPAMYYNYEDKTFEEAYAPRANQPSLRDLLTSVRAACPGFEAEVKKRHERMKILFNRALQRRQPTSSPQTVEAWAPPTPQPQVGAKSPVKAGRNDPCPCGSGRKFKKCCGR